MAKKKEPSFIDISSEGPVSSIDEDNKKITDNLAKKVDKMYKVFASKSVKKLFDNSNEINKIVEKELKSVDPKATKIDKLDSEDGTMAILNKILTFMQKTHDEDKLALEEQKNFAEEQALEKAKRQRDMLDTLIEKKKGEKTPKSEKEEEKSLMDSFGDMGSVLFNVAKWFAFTPLGAMILGATTLLGLMAMAGKESHQEASNVQKAGDVSNEGAAIMNIDSIDKRKAKLLREAHKSGKIKASWWEYKKADQEEKAYLKEIGFDPKTGLTDADREKGYNFIDEDGNPIFSEYQDKQNKAQSIPAVTTPSEGTTPAPSSGSSPAPTATPAPASNAGSQVTAATNQNLDSKLQETVDSSQQALQNSSTNIMNMGKDRSPKDIQPVRNQEATFQRMIFNNTRIV